MKHNDENTFCECSDCLYYGAQDSDEVDRG